ncbi:hypothetical protein [Marinilactibacillus sp. Marseille-P9653]|uniref:hypothetical protein n=1 Tax=Marinilactibacillus sp. Marseille-P9653 TaxID=2866583 RepID=UPI001CE43E21|nr:hypothetical protein [Marinilactibacillus sp. Marseille-P9653]
MSLYIIFGNVQSFAAFITAIITIGSSLMWVYQKTIGKAKERRIEKENRLLRKKIDESNKPLIDTLTMLNEYKQRRITG